MVGLDDLFCAILGHLDESSKFELRQLSDPMQ